jgi:hypothetical protein
MESCEFRATNTDTIWKVDPSNVSNKPICKYHHYLKELMKTSVLPLLTIFITFILSLKIGINFNSIWSIPVYFGLFVTLALSISIGMFLFELAVRYFLMDIPILRRRIRIIDECGQLDEKKCICCGEKNCEGTWREYSKRLEFIGTPIKYYEKGVNHYCESCAKKESQLNTDISEEKQDEKNLLLKDSK